MSVELLESQIKAAAREAVLAAVGGDSAKSAHWLGELDRLTRELGRIAESTHPGRSSKV